MKTLELLTTPEVALAPKLKHLKLKELERHVKKLLLRTGNADYSEVLRTVIKVVPTLEGEGSSRYKIVQDIVRGFFQKSDVTGVEDKEIVERIAVILMIIIAKKFEKIHDRKD